MCAGSFYLGMYAMSFFVSALSIDRILAIFGKGGSRVYRTPNKAKIISIILWVNI